MILRAHDPILCASVVTLLATFLFCALSFANHKLDTGVMRHHMLTAKLKHCEKHLELALNNMSGFDVVFTEKQWAEYKREQGVRQ